MNQAVIEREQRALRCLDEVLEVPPADRRQFIAARYGSDATLAGDLERLLQAGERAESGVFAESINACLLPVLTDLEARAMDAADSSEALRKTFAPRYSVHERLGQGGMATVYLAFDHVLGRQVAIKVLRQELADGLSLERFEREIAIAGMLDHPRIVAVHDRGDAGGRLYFVMPYIAGGSLRDLLRERSQLEIREAIAITRDVADALDAAHAQKVVHRDIKPENILLDERGAHVADFGVARLVDAAGRDRLTRTGVAIGTAHYMSPEQAESSATVGGRSDIYALACVLYEMLAGEPPYTAPSRHDVIAKHMAAAIPDLAVVRATITRPMQQVVARALQKSPADRFASARDFADAFERAYVASGAQERIETRGPWSRSFRDRRVLVAAALVAVVAAPLVIRRLTSGPVVNRAAVTAASVAGAFADDSASRRIAVLYFEDLSPDKRLGHVAAGLTEDLIDQLSQVPLLRVTSPNGVRPFREVAVPIDTIRERFGVGTIIGGSVSASGAILRVTVRVIDARTGAQLNSMTSVQPTLNLFHIQDTLASDVAFWLRERLGRQVRLQRPPTARSARAWELVQRGEELSRQGYFRGLRSDSTALGFFAAADSMFATAETIDRGWDVPIVARARNAMSGAFARTVQSRQTPEAVRGLRDAVTFAERALKTNPQAAAAMSIRGEATLRLVTLARLGPHDSLLAAATSDLEKAASLRPDLARTWYALGELRRWRGRNTEAVEAYRTAYDTDPFLSDVQSVLGSMITSMLAAKQFDDAGKWCAFARRRFSGDLRFTDCQLTVLGWSGRTARAVDSAWQILNRIESADTAGGERARWTWHRMLVAAVAARARMSDSARGVLRRTELERRDRAPAEIPLAYVHLLLGDREQALTILRQYATTLPTSVQLIATHPWFAELQSDPWFRGLAKSN